MTKECVKCKMQKPTTEFTASGPNRYMAKCKKCRREHDRHRRITDPAWKERANQRTNECNKQKRQTVLAHYGGKCACCGEDKYEFLSIDHINGGGNQHRKSIANKGGANFSKWLLRNGLPEGYRVLCHNCNQSLGHYGHCPHNPDFR